MNTNINLPAVKFGGAIRFYFPDFPDHKLNGMMQWGAGAFTGDFNGKKTRSVAYGMHPNGLDQSYITTDMFGTDKVLVKSWHHGCDPEYFYLTNK